MIVTYILVLTLTFAKPLVFAESGEIEASCMELFSEKYIKKMCCQSEIMDNMHKESEKCAKKDDKDLTCDDFKCLLGEDGLLDGNNIDEAKAMEQLEKMEKDHPKDKATIQRMKNMCLDGKYRDFSESDCDALNFFACFHLNSLLECESWKDDKDCSKMAEHAKKCKDVLDH